MQNAAYAPQGQWVQGQPASGQVTYQHPPSGYQIVQQPQAVMHTQSTDNGPAWNVPAAEVPWQQRTSKDGSWAPQGPAYVAPAQAAAPAPALQQMAVSQFSPENPRTWTGVVSQILNADYGIVDGDAFYHVGNIAGEAPRHAGQRVRCVGCPNRDGGKYTWRILRIELAESAEGRPQAAALGAATAPVQTKAAMPVASNPAIVARGGRTGRGRGRGGGGRGGDAGPGRALPQADVRRPEPARPAPAAARASEHARFDSARSAAPASGAPQRPAQGERQRRKRWEDAGSPAPARQQRPPPARALTPPAAARRPPSPAPAPASAPLLPGGLTYLRHRSLTDVADRHKKLYVPSEFMRQEALWLDGMRGTRRLRLDMPVKFELQEAPLPMTAKAVNGTAAARSDPAQATAGAAVPRKEGPAGDAPAGAHGGEVHGSAGGERSGGERNGTGEQGAGEGAAEQSADGGKEGSGKSDTGRGDGKGAVAEAEGAAAGAGTPDGKARAAPGKTTRARAKSTGVGTPTGADGGPPAPAGEEGGAAKAVHDWGSMTVVQLKSACAKRKLAVRGNKADLIRRLEEAEGPAVAAAAAAAGEPARDTTPPPAATNSASQEDAIIALALSDDPPAVQAAPAAPDAATAGPARPAAAKEAPAKKASGQTGKGRKGGEGEERAAHCGVPAESSTGEAVGGEAASAKSKAPEPGAAAGQGHVSHGAPSAGTAAAAPVAAEPGVPSGVRGSWWSAKVLLLGGLPAALLHAPSSDRFQHPLATPCLVRKRHHRDLSLLGGQWTPADGAHPALDPGALIATATRTVLEQTGVDLSQAGEWTRLIEVQYRRPSARDAQPDSEAAAGHVHRTVVFVVNAAHAAEPNAVGLSELAAAQGAPARAEEARSAASRARAALEAAEADVREAAAAAARLATSGGDAAAVLLPPELEGMVVAELKAELARRGADQAWDPAEGKAVLVERIKEHAKAAGARHEQAKQASERQALTARNHAAAKTASLTAADSASRAAAAAVAAGKVLANPPAPLVLRAASMADGELTVQTLGQLLEYSVDDTKESTFELSLAAEAIVEMLAMHFGAVVAAALPRIAAADTVASADGRSDRGAGAGGSGSAAVKAESEEAPAVAEVVKDGRVGSDDAEMAEPEATDDSGAAAATTSQAEKGSRKRGATDSGGAEAPEPATKKVRGAARSSDPAATQLAAPPCETLLLACRFFDEPLSGFLDAADLEAIVHTTHWHTTRRWVLGLVDAACRRGRLRYLKYADMRVPIQPGLLPPLAHDAGQSGGGLAQQGSGSGVMVELDGAIVDVGAMVGKVRDGQAKLQSAAGAARMAEDEAKAAAARADALQVEVDATRKHNKALREELAGLKAAAAKAKASAGAAERLQEKVESLLSSAHAAAKDMRKGLGELALA